MSYLTFNEGIFTNIKNNVSRNINTIKSIAQKASGSVLGKIKKVSQGISNGANVVTNKISDVGNSIGAKFSDDENKQKNDFNNKTKKSILRKNRYSHINKE